MSEVTRVSEVILVDGTCLELMFLCQHICMLYIIHYHSPFHFVGSSVGVNNVIVNVIVEGIFSSTFISFLFNQK